MANTPPKATLPDIICQNIKKDITQQILRPGDHINVRELAQRYGTSETPVKLALNRLISEKIIVNFPRQGMQVRTIQPDEVEEIFDMRLMLDLYYTQKIITAVNYNDRLRQALQTNVTEHMALVQALTPDSPVEEYIKNYEYDTQFHELYLKCSGCQKIVDIYHYICPFQYSNYIFHRQSKNKDITGVKEHEMILQAIFNEDEAALREALTVHMLNAKHAVGLILKVDQIL